MGQMPHQQFIESTREQFEQTKRGQNTDAELETDLDSGISATRRSPEKATKLVGPNRVLWQAISRLHGSPFRCEGPSHLFETASAFSAWYDMYRDHPVPLPSSAVSYIPKYELLTH